MAPTLDHFGTAVDAAGFWTFARNSLVLTLGSVLLALLVALLAATAVPARAPVPRAGGPSSADHGRADGAVGGDAHPDLHVVRDTDMLNSLLALIPLYMVMVLPFTVWTLRGFIAAVPMELEEAAHGRRLQPRRRRSAGSSSRCWPPA